MMDRIKGYGLALLALVTGVLYALFRGQQRKTAEAEAALAKATFHLTTQENDKKYEDAKQNADRLVTEYQSSKRSDTSE
jgi:hypothetical protein